MSNYLTQVTYGWSATCKGEAKAVAKQTLTFNNQLQSIFQQQFAGQQAALGQLSTTLNNMINNPQGYSPAGLAAMQTQATEGNARQFANAQQGLNQQLQTLTGGGQLPSGAAAMLQGQLESSEAANQSNALLGIAQQNANVQLQQQQQGLSMLPGVIAQQGQLPGSIGAVQNQQQVAFNQAQQAFKSPWASILGGIAGTALNTFTGGLAGTVGSAIGGGLFGGGQSQPQGNLGSILGGYNAGSQFANPINPGTGWLGGYTGQAFGANPVPFVPSNFNAGQQLGNVSNLLGGPGH